MKKLCLGILGAFTLVVSSYSAAFQFNSVTTYSQETPLSAQFTVGLVTHIQGNLPMAVDLANVNEATSFRIGASAMWGGDDFQVLLGQDPAYKPGATKASINTPSGNVQLSWTATNVTFSAVLINNHSAPGFIGFPVFTPIPLGANGPFATNTTISVHFQYYDFTHPASLTGTNKVVSYLQSSFSIIPGTPPILTYAFVNTGKFRVTADLIAPTIKFNSPVQNTVVTNDNLIVSLTVADNVLLGTGPSWLGGGAVLAYAVNGGSFAADANSVPGVISTTHSIDLNGAIQPGTNVITFIAADSSGNLGTNTLVLFYSQRSAITLFTNGVGGITGISNGQMLEIGRNYAITAKPGTGKILSAWQDEFGAVLGRSNTLVFKMHDGMSLTASFADNPYPVVQGNYLGSFIENGGSPAVDQFGSFKMTLGNSGSFSGTLISAVGSQAFSGQFLYSSNGVQTASCVAKGKTTNFIYLNLVTDPASANFATVSGSLDYGSSAGVRAVSPRRISDAEIQAGRATNATVLQGGAGSYHFAVVPFTNDVNFPGGQGFGTMTISADGTVKGSVSLADGDAPVTTFSSHVVSTGYVPVFVPFYSKTGGFLFTANLGIVPSDGSVSNVSTATWVKSAGKPFYPLGFNTANGVFAARFNSVIKNGSVGSINLELDPDVLIGGSVALVNGAFSPTSTLQGNPKGTITPSGNMTGTFVDGTVTRSFKGIVVPSVPDGFQAVGFFVRSNQTGSVELDVSP